MKAIILANGEFPKNRASLQALVHAELIICCDGAYNKMVTSHLFDSIGVKQPAVHVVGDGDSTDSVLRREERISAHFVDGYTDQECNDLTKAVRYALTLGVDTIDIYGATGLREDHTLGNISLLAQYAMMPAKGGHPLEVRMITDYGVFLPLLSSAVLPSFKGQQVSLFSLSPDLVVTVEGLKYPIQKRRLRWWWEATLNEALGDHFSVILEGEGPLLVYLVN